MKKFSLALHGGAGTIPREEMTPEKEALYLTGLGEALNAGYEILHNGGSSIDAVEECVVILENNELFNAGRGSVFTGDGRHEMDAAIMDGASLRAGAVAGVSNIRNPISLARAVMDKSSYVLLGGAGAKKFADTQRIPAEPDEYFFNQYRFDQWQSVRGTDATRLDHSSDRSRGAAKSNKFGTVGAVARDINGNVAAATSTGGMTNKKFGRIGDSPLIGSGTYASNHTCAISCTGYGEAFIRAVAAYDVSCLMEYKGLTLDAAMNLVVNDKLVKLDGEGGMIGVDATGAIAMLFNCSGMYRACQDSGGKKEIDIYRTV